MYFRPVARRLGWKPSDWTKDHLCFSTLWANSSLASHRWACHHFWARSADRRPRLEPTDRACFPNFAFFNGPTRDISPEWWQRCRQKYCDHNENYFRWHSFFFYRSRTTSSSTKLGSSSSSQPQSISFSSFCWWKTCVAPFEARRAPASYCHFIFHAFWWSGGCSSWFQRCRRRNCFTCVFISSWSHLAGIHECSTGHFNPL